MKTKELIRLLQEEDPSGEIEVCVGNIDIYYVERLPAYYDGRLQVLKRDPDTKYYNVIGAEYKSSGSKINIRTLSIYDAIWNDPDIPIDCSEVSEDYKKSIEETRRQVKEYKYNSELDYFVRHITRRVESQDEGNLEGIEEICKKFFDQNLSCDDPLSSDISLSYIERRNLQWERQVNVECVGNEVILTKREE